MKLSILLPTHNRPDVLRWAIESVLAQDFRDFELLVCGDGCTDSTGDLVKQYAARDARVRWFDLPKAPGFGYANRNTVFAQAQGELIGFMAHDDLVTNDHFGRLAGLLEDPQARMAHTGSARVDRDGAIFPAVFHFEDRRMLDDYLEMRANRVPATCVMHRRTAFDEVGCWNAELLRDADRDFFGRIIRHYGRETLRASPVTTAFHFRAAWREGEASWSDPLFKALRAQPGRLSRWLQVPVLQGRTEQETLWHLMRDDPKLVDRVRDGCVHAVMAHDWEMESVSLPACEERLARCKDKLGQKQQQCAALRQERDALKAKLHKRESGVRRWWKQLKLTLRRTR